jgi:choline dehydrogenase-like flavoprotein
MADRYTSSSAAAPAAACFCPRPGTVWQEDQRSSVPDVNGKARDLDNLHVTGASFVPGIGTVNPALTVIANAIWVGDHLAQRPR